MLWKCSSIRPAFARKKEFAAEALKLVPATKNIGTHAKDNKAATKERFHCGFSDKTGFYLQNGNKKDEFFNPCFLMPSVQDDHNMIVCIEKVPVEGRVISIPLLQNLKDIKIGEALTIAIESSAHPTKRQKT